MTKPKNNLKVYEMSLCILFLYIHSCIKAGHDLINKISRWKNTATTEAQQATPPLFVHYISMHRNT